MLRDLQASHKALLDVDWQEAEAGLYPTSLSMRPRGLGRPLPLVWLDMPSTGPGAPSGMCVICLPTSSRKTIRHPSTTTKPMAT